MTTTLRYPLYRDEEQIAWIDDTGRVRDLSGRFVSIDRDEAEDLLAACRHVRIQRAPGPQANCPACEDGYICRHGPGCIVDEAFGPEARGE